jgi:hypothetical protein
MFWKAYLLLINVTYTFALNHTLTFPFPVTETRKGKNERSTYTLNAFDIVVEKIFLNISLI